MQISNNAYRQVFPPAPDASPRPPPPLEVLDLFLRFFQMVKIFFLVVLASQYAGKL